MCAMTPRLRILSSWYPLAAAIGRPQKRLTAENAEERREDSSPRSFALSAVNPTRSPGEVRERLVGVRHLDRVFPLGHRLALAAVGGHQLVGQPQEHRLAGLASGGADDPAD